MTRSRRVKDLGVLAALAAVYFIAAKLGLRLALVHPSATAVWPPAGIALAALLVLGYRAWPAIFVGAFFANVTTEGSIATSIGIGTGNTLEAVVGAYLVNRFAHGRGAFDHAPDVFKFAALAALGSTTVSATAGVTSLSLGAFANWADAGSIWFTWWLGDVAGDLVLAPLLLLWIANPRVRWDRGQILEGAALLLGLLFVGQIVFGELLAWGTGDYPLEFLCIPFFIWAAFRFGPREAATATFVLSGIAIWGTLKGWGPFARASPNESLLLLQAFIGVSAVMTLALAAVVSESRRVAEQLRELAERDPLTGLANYRRFMQALEAEVRRSRRTERSLALLFLDLDGLKQINDRHGHLVGSRALCRLAEILHVSCRAIDTSARLGGDEFAVVFPETEEAAARRVGLRIGKRLAADGAQPPLSVSVGVAVYPRDGETAVQLLDAADRALYEVKARGGGLLAR